MINLNFPVSVNYPEDFYDRREATARVRQVLRSPNPQSVMIRGERRIGKTSLLNIISYYLTEWLPSSIGILLPHGDNIRSFDQFSKEILYKLRLALNDDFSDSTFGGGDDSFVSVGQLVDAIAHLTATHADTIVLLIDEFDATIANCSSADAGKILATINHLQEKTEIPFVTILTTTTQYPDIKNAEFIELKPFSNDDMVAMVVGLADKKVSFSDAALERLFYFSGGHPFLVKGILRQLWLTYANETNITPAMVDRAVEVAAGDATLDATLKNIYMVHFSAGEKYIMLRLAAQEDVNSREGSMPQLITARNQLLRRNYITIDGSGYLAFRSNFWRTWLQNMDEYHDELALLSI